MCSAFFLPFIMHRALFIEEILHGIFSHCYPERSNLVSVLVQGYPPDDLGALACTCQAFKEPALDMLWMELKNPTPLA